MGQYVYTMRNDFKKVGDLKIGRFQYAYKEHWGSSSDSNILRYLQRSAEVASDNPDIEYVVVADKFTEASSQPLPIYKKHNYSHYCFDYPRYMSEEGNYEPIVIGYLVKNGRNYFIRKTDHEG